MMKILAFCVCFAAITVSHAQFSLTLNKNSVAGQNFVQGTINLDSTSTTDTQVATYDNSSLVVTPASVTVWAGTTLRTFPITVSAVNSQINTTIFARLGTVTKSQPLTLTPVVPTALAFNPNIVIGGAPLVGRVVINGVAGPGGRVISIFDNSAFSDVPKTVTVPPGATDAFFNITTKVVTSFQTVTVTAKVSAGMKTGTFRIRPKGFSQMLRFDSNFDGIQLKGGTYAGACDLRQHFTVEAIIRPSSLVLGMVWQQWADGSMNEALTIQPENYYFIGTGAGSPDKKYFGNQLTVNGWAHLAWVYDGTTARVYRNGQLESTLAISGSLCPLVVAQAASIGRNSTVPFTAEPPFMGDLAAFRISRVARYSSPFSPPTVPWTDDADTLMLLDPSSLTTLPTTFSLPGTAGLIANPGKGNASATPPTLMPYTL